MSQNGKGSNTAKRTNFKVFNERFDLIDWGKKEPEPTPTLPPEVQEKLDGIKQSIEEYDNVLRERNGKDEAGE